MADAMIRQRNPAATSYNNTNAHAHDPLQTRTLAVPYHKDIFTKDDLGIDLWNPVKPDIISGQPLIHKVITPGREQQEAWSCPCHLPKPPHIDHDPHLQILKHLHEELCVVRLDGLARPVMGLGLWMAGYRGYVQPLWRQKMRDRDIVVTHQTDMHLVWWKGKVYLKPIPPYLLDWGFFNHFLCTDTATSEARQSQSQQHYDATIVSHYTCIKQSELFKSALGLLMTYTKLIRTPADLHIAQDHKLVPSNITWPAWSHFASQIIDYINSHSHSISEQLTILPPRYTFGELRLGRLNLIHRLRGLGWRGYFVGYNDYGTFLGESFGWMVVVFLWLTTALTAMQVATATVTSVDSVAESAINDTSYWFSIVTLIIVAGGVALIAGVFGGVVVQNVLHALWSAGMKKKKGRGKTGRGDEDVEGKHGQVNGGGGGGSLLQQTQHQDGQGGVVDGGMHV